MINELFNHSSDEKFISSAELYSRVLNSLQSTIATKVFLHKLLNSHPIHGTCHAIVKEFDRGRLITDLNKVNEKEVIKAQLYKPGEITLFPAVWQIQDRSKFDAIIWWSKCFLVQNYVGKPLIIRNRKSKGVKEEVFGSRLLIYGLRFLRADVVTGISFSGISICLEDTYHRVDIQRLQQDGRSEHDWSRISVYESLAMKGRLAEALDSVEARGSRTRLVELLNECFDAEAAPSRPTLFRKAAQLIETNSKARTARTP